MDSTDSKPLLDFEYCDDDGGDGDGTVADSQGIYNKTAL